MRSVSFIVKYLKWENVSRSKLHLLKRTTQLKTNDEREYVTKKLPLWFHKYVKSKEQLDSLPQTVLTLSYRAATIKQMIERTKEQMNKIMV